MRNMAVLHSPAFSYPLPVLVRVLFNLLIFKGKILYYNKYNENFGTANGCRSFFIFFCRLCLFVSEQLYFHAERQAQDVAHGETFVGYLADEIQLAGTQFIEQGDVAY